VILHFMADSATRGALSAPVQGVAGKSAVVDQEMDRLWGWRYP